MTVNEAYELAMATVKELEDSGIKVHRTPSLSRNDPYMVNKYCNANRITPGKWFHITFYCSNQKESRRIHEKVRFLGNMGIAFDTGGGMNQRDWELDWSFRVSEKPDSDTDIRRDIVEDILDNGIEKR